MWTFLKKKVCQELEISLVFQRHFALDTRSQTLSLNPNYSISIFEKSICFTSFGVGSSISSKGTVTSPLTAEFNFILTPFIQGRASIELRLNETAPFP